MKRKFGIELECLRYTGLSDGTVLRMIKDAGFDSVFSNKYEISEVSAIKAEAVKLGLDVEFLHAPF